MDSSRTLYDILQVARIASPDVIEASYLKLAAKLDPASEGNPKDELAAAKYKALKEAFTTLSDPKRRNLYDARLRSLEHATAVEVFWTPVRIFVFGLCLLIAAAMFWKYRGDVARAEVARITAENEKAAKVAAEKKRLDEVAAEEAEAAREQVAAARERAQAAYQQREMESARRHADSISRQNNAERERYERQLESERQREDLARSRERQVAESNARRQIAEDERRLRQIEAERSRRSTYIGR